MLVSFANYAASESFWETKYKIFHKFIVNFDLKNTN